MLEHDDASRLRSMVRAGSSSVEIGHVARAIQLRMNPHPGGQMDLNVPLLDGVQLSGCQHKYRETVLFFPKAGQTCHAFCTYCFRWPQFVGIEHFRFAMNEVDLLVTYLRRNRQVSNVLVTGGDPMVMSSAALRRSVEPLLGDGLEHVTTIRFGTKSLATWPYRFTTDSDADDLLRLFEDIIDSGRQVAIMAHYSHPRELQTRAAREAVRRVRDAGAVVRCQSPVVRHVNDRPEVWAELWREEVRLGTVPYYMFVARNTGPHRYFELPLARCLQIFSEAYARVCGLARGVRGPVMSATAGKVQVVGVTEVDQRKVFVLKMIQGRDPSCVNRLILANFDSRAAWIDELEPARDVHDCLFGRPGPDPRSRGRHPQPAMRAGDLPGRPPALNGNVDSC
jgi:L-lysine 2,3-aminomutase